MTVWHSVICEEQRKEITSVHPRSLKAVSCAAGFFFVDGVTGEWLTPKEYARREIGKLKDGEALLITKEMAP